MDDIAALEKDSEAMNILQAKRAKSDRSFGRGSPRKCLNGINGIVEVGGRSTGRDRGERSRGKMDDFGRRMVKEVVLRRPQRLGLPPRSGNQFGRKSCRPAKGLGLG